MSDRKAVARQIGRNPKPFHVAARCPYGPPSVIENERSRSMPTSFWITCKYLDSAIAGIESSGGVRAAQEAVGHDTVEAIHTAHQNRYGTRVAGVRDGGYVKCLHAFTALHLAGAIPNSVAEWTIERLEDPYPKDGCCVSEERQT